MENVVVKITACLSIVLAVMCLCWARGQGRCVGGEIGVKGASFSSLHCGRRVLGHLGAADPFY